MQSLVKFLVSDASTTSTLAVFATTTSLAYLSLPKPGPGTGSAILPWVYLLGSAVTTLLYAGVVEIPGLAGGWEDGEFASSSLTSSSSFVFLPFQTLALAITWLAVFGIAGAPLASLTTSTSTMALLWQVPLAALVAGHNLGALAAGSSAVWVPPLAASVLAAVRGRSPAGAWGHLAFLGLASLALGSSGTLVVSKSLDALVVLLAIGTAIVTLRLRTWIDDAAVAASETLAELGSADEYLADADAKLHYNAALFRVVAPAYDFITQALSLGRDGAWKRALIEDIRAISLSAARQGGEPTERIVDIACGTGDLAFALGSHFPDADVVGTDLTEAMIDLAIERPEAETADNVMFVVGDMCDLPFYSNAVDLVTGSYALRNAPSLLEALEETNRVLRVGGHAAFLDFSKPSFGPLAAIYYAILLVWGGLWGILVHGSPAVYAYIARSLWEFPNENELEGIFEFAGFEVVKTRKFFFGLIAVNIVRKLVDVDLLDAESSSDDEEVYNHELEELVDDDDDVMYEDDDFDVYEQGQDGRSGRFLGYYVPGEEDSDFELEEAYDEDEEEESDEDEIEVDDRTMIEVLYDAAGQILGYTLYNPSDDDEEEFDGEEQYELIDIGGDDEDEDDYLEFIEGDEDGEGLELALTRQGSSGSDSDDQDEEDQDDDVDQEQYDAENFVAFGEDSDGEFVELAGDGVGLLDVVLEALMSPSDDEQGEDGEDGEEGEDEEGEEDEEEGEDEE